MHSEQPRGPASESPHSISATDHSTVQFVAVHKNWASLMKTLRQACDSICVLSAHAMSRALFSILVSCPRSCRPPASVSPDRIMPDRKDITVHPDAVSYDGRQDRCLRSIDRHVFQCMPRSRASCNSCTAASRLNLRGRTPYPNPCSDFVLLQRHITYVQRAAHKGQILLLEGRNLRRRNHFDLTTSAESGAQARQRDNRYEPQVNSLGTESQ